MLLKLISLVVLCTFIGNAVRLWKSENIGTNCIFYHITYFVSYTAALKAEERIDQFIVLVHDMSPTVGAGNCL